jgi:catechol 2,3-dioxygenase-like lactoylglutathione lyase family enzyme
MDMKLEVVVVPVSDVERAKEFYTALGWRLDADVATGEDFRVVQVTPPGSAASVIFGTSVTDQAPGSARGLHLIVDDIDAAHDELKRRGAEPSEVFHDAGGVFHHAGTAARVPRTETATSCRRSPPGSRAGWTPRAPTSPRPTTWPAPCAGPRRRTASTRRASARRTPTGRTGTPGTWSPNRPARNRPPDRRVHRSRTRPDAPGPL